MSSNPSQPSCGNRRMPRGFTLVEILCVVVILGIASAIIIPQIGSRDDLVAAAAARIVMADIIHAQNRAIADQKPFYIQFNGQNYQIFDQPPGGGATPINHPVTKSAYSVTFGAANTGLANVSLVSTSPAVLGFDELGSPFSYASNTATPLVADGSVVVRAGAITLTISIEPYTGEATVQ